MSEGKEPDNVEPISLEPEDIVPDPPPLPGTVVALKSSEAVIDRLGSDILEQALECVREFGDFHLALSGGNTPMPLYRSLMLDPAYRHLPWRKTHLWIVDERRVPFDNDRSNYKHIKEIIGEHSDIPSSQLHPMDAVRDDADVAYEEELREVLGWREKGQDRLDFVVLGMGPDGHTASLFPNSRALSVTDRLVTLNDGPTVVPPDRVTMTYTLLNASRMLAPLVMGSEKAEMIARIANGDDPSHDIPIKGIDPIGGNLRWYLDASACGDAQPESEEK
jgi:6-phosphogluconolactonase